jgi:hypothetical protein
MLNIQGSNFQGFMHLVCRDYASFYFTKLIDVIVAHLLHLLSNKQQHITRLSASQSKQTITSNLRSGAPMGLHVAGS